VQLCDPPRFATRTVNSVRGSRRRGLIYQGEILARLCEIYDLECLPEPWFFAHGVYSSPDALVIDLPRGIVHIVEVKLHHTPAAFDKLRNRYLPLLDELLNNTSALRVVSDAAGRLSECPLRGSSTTLKRPTSARWRFTLTEISRSYDALQRGAEVQIARPVFGDFRSCILSPDGINVMTHVIQRKW
jgi:hypothetical protein